MTATRPRIAVTASLAHDAAGAIHGDVVPYVRALERAGAQPVFAANDATGVDTLLAGVAGVVLGGGVDVDPARYCGRTAHARSQAGRYRPDRDDFEIALARALRERGVPTLAICRGLQVANVAFGGTLVEDVEEDLGPSHAIDHQQMDPQSGLERADYAPGHTVMLEAGSDLAALACVASFATNSMHHQAVREPAQGLRVAGRTSDGVIEAMEATFPHPFFFAVQWHPEALRDDAISNRLFAALVRASAANASRL